ncbi:MAG: DNA polymerase III subunit epsilon [Pseudomonadota bacterium]
MKREIVLDTETTGLDPFSGHRIVEIGCVELIDGLRTGKTFHTYLNPERDMPSEAFRVHGLSEQFLADKPVFAEKIDELMEFISDSMLVIHNAAFDMKFVNFELDRLGFSAISMERTIDTVLIARKKFPGSPANLDALCKRFNIDLSERTKHGALLDAELLSEVYLELMGGRQSALLLDISSKSLVSESQLVVTDKIKLENRVFNISAEEEEVHKLMLSKLKNPLWLEVAE